MRDILLKICPVSIWVIVALEAVLAVLLLLRAIKTKKPIPWLSFFITVGLIIDAALIALGAVLPAENLKAVSPVRFVAHGLLIPLIFPILGYALKWKKPAMTVLWIVTVLLMAAGVAEGLATKLELREIAGVVRYASNAETPKWADVISRILSFGTVIPMMIVGIIVWIKEKTPHLFLSGFFMFAFSAIGPATGNSDLIFFISMFGELLMILFLYLFCLAKKRGKKA